MNSFYLHKLRSRTYPFSYIFQELISDFGFHSIEHKLAHVSVNNSYWGLMDMQETFGSTMMAKNKIRESLIIKFSDDYYWKNYLRSNTNPLPREKYWLSHPRLFISSVSKPNKRLVGNELLKFNYIANIIKEDGYQDILFNQRMLSEAEEILSVWGNFHPAGLNNIYFYFNPFTLKLEPVMTDQGRFQDIRNTYKEKSLHEVTYGLLKAKRLKPSERRNIQDNTLKGLERLIPYKVSETYFPSDKKLNLIYPKNNYEFVRNNQEHKSRPHLIYKEKIECKSDQNMNLDFHTLQATYNKRNLNITPLVCGEFRIKEINICNKKIVSKLRFNHKDIILSKPIKVNISSLLDEKLFKRSNCNNQKNFLIYEYLGDEKNLSINYLPYLDITLNPLRELSVPKFIKKESNQNFISREGKWIVKNPIIVNGNLEIIKNTQLIFAPNTYMIIKGGLDVNGTLDEPVNMRALEKDKGWKGVYVYNETKQKNYSNINNLMISDAKETNVGILNLTGGLTFYNSNLTVDNLSILNSKAEDGINIVNSEVDIKGLNISQSKSDGLDCDFCKGKIEDVELINIGGDGLDFSGSIINGKVNKASNVKDKVISIGEESNVDFDVNNVKNSFLVAAVKDGSKSKIKLNNIQTNGNIIMSYVKKDYYTKRTKIDVYYDKDRENLDLKKFITTDNADLYVNKNKIKASKLDIKALYKTYPMKK